MIEMRRLRNTDNISKTNFDKSCFQHDMAYGKFKNLAKRTQSDKVVRDKAFEIGNNSKHDGYQRGLVSMVYKFFHKKSAGAAIKSVSNQQLENELHKPIIRKFRKEKFILHLNTIFGM